MVLYWLTLPGLLVVAVIPAAQGARAALLERMLLVLAVAVAVPGRSRAVPAASDAQATAS